jgi:hypothetical protein
MSTRTVPVKYSTGPANEACEPPRVTVIACGSGITDGALFPADPGGWPSPRAGRPASRNERAAAVKSGRRPLEGNGSGEAEEPAPPQPERAALRRRWANLIRRVYEVDPLVCARCGAEMGFSITTPTARGGPHRLRVGPPAASTTQRGESCRPRARRSTGTPNPIALLSISGLRAPQNTSGAAPKGPPRRRTQTRPRIEVPSLKRRPSSSSSWQVALDGPFLLFRLLESVRSHP